MEVYRHSILVLLSLVYLYSYKHFFLHWMARVKEAAAQQTSWRWIMSFTLIM